MKDCPTGMFSIPAVKVLVTLFCHRLTRQMSNYLDYVGKQCLDVVAFTSTEMGATPPAGVSIQSWRLEEGTRFPRTILPQIRDGRPNHHPAKLEASRSCSSPSLSPVHLQPTVVLVENHLTRNLKGIDNTRTHWPLPGIKAICAIAFDTSVSLLALSPEAVHSLESFENV